MSFPKPVGPDDAGSVERLAGDDWGPEEVRGTYGDVDGAQPPDLSSWGDAFSKPDYSDPIQYPHLADTGHYATMWARRGSDTQASSSNSLSGRQGLFETGSRSPARNARASKSLSSKKPKSKPTASSSASSASASSSRTKKSTEPFMKRHPRFVRALAGTGTFIFGPLFGALAIAPAILALPVGAVIGGIQQKREKTAILREYDDSGVLKAAGLKAKASSAQAILTIFMPVSKCYNLMKAANRHICEEQVKPENQPNIDAVTIMGSIRKDAKAASEFIHDKLQPARDKLEDAIDKINTKLKAVEKEWEDVNLG